MIQPGLHREQTDRRSSQPDADTAVEMLVVVLAGRERDEMGLNVDACLSMVQILAAGKQSEQSSLAGPLEGFWLRHGCRGVAIIDNR